MIVMVGCMLQIHGPNVVEESRALFKETYPPPGHVLTLKKRGKPKRAILVTAVCIDEAGIVITADAISSPSD